MVRGRVADSGGYLHDLDIYLFYLNWLLAVCWVVYLIPALGIPKPQEGFTLALKYSQCK